MVRAKMTVSEIKRYRGNVRNPETDRWELKELQAVKLNCVAGGSPEDNTFSTMTPVGSLELSITNPGVVGFFELGESYYVDLTPAE